MHHYVSSLRKVTALVGLNPVSQITRNSDSTLISDLCCVNQAQGAQKVLELLLVHQFERAKLHVGTDDYLLLLRMPTITKN